MLEHADVTQPRVPLNIDPDADLYETGLLFHGARFRRLREVYAVSEQRCAFAVEERAPAASTSSGSATARSRTTAGT